MIRLYIIINLILYKINIIVKYSIGPTRESCNSHGTIRMRPNGMISLNDPRLGVKIDSFQKGEALSMMEGSVASADT